MKLILSILSKWLPFLSIFMVILAPMLTRFGMINYKIGLPLFALGSVLAMISLFFVFVMFFFTLHGGQDRKHLFELILTAVILLIPTFMIVKSFKTVSKFPMIHEASTDLENPPEFSARVVEIRKKSDANSLDLATKKTGKGDSALTVMKKSHADIKPVVIKGTLETAVEQVKKSVEALGWKLTTSEKLDDGTMRVSAYQQSFWFGFIDDIVIRLEPRDNDDVIVNIRSVSRVGESDLGANATRVRKFLDKLDTEK